MSDRQFWLGFSLVPEIGPKRLALLLNAFGSLEQAWGASESALHRAGLDPQPTANLLRTRAKIDLQAELDKIARAGAQLVTLVDECYPPLLKQIPDAPVILYVRGSLLTEDQRALAIVGTRKATTYGKDVAGLLAGQLAERGITVISGLAHGIDAAAHRAALEAGGRTIAVMGCGIDQVYPRDHGELARRISEQGAVISEFPLGARPEAHHFPRRNRVISGMSLGVLVVEAPEQSGAMITTSYAAEHGREVFAVPGSIFSAVSSGTNRLIQDGAKLVLTVEDILSELNLAHEVAQTRVTAERIAPANPIEASIIDCLSAEPLHIDDLVRQTGLPIATVSSTLTVLELKGLARMVGHMQYNLVYSR